MGADQPNNIEEASSIVFDALSSHQKEHLRQLREEDLINEHFGYSSWVRNLLGHWIPPMPKGEVYNPAHPDDISGKITEMSWKKFYKAESLFSVGDNMSSAKNAYLFNLELKIK